MARTFPIDGDAIGTVEHYTVKETDNLYEVARQYDIGIVEILSANPGIDPWTPSPGTDLTIANMHLLPPGERHGIVINLSELRLFYYVNDRQVMTFPIGIGREGWLTPMGKTRILRKRKNPIWTPPPSIRAENPELAKSFLPGPDNPLGDYALDLGIPGVLIHGTNRPYGIGKRSSHGCIRLYPEDIKILFEAIKVGTPVTIIDTPYKLAWQGDILFLEVTPTQVQSDEIADYKQPAPINFPELKNLVKNYAGDDTNVDWNVIEDAIKKHNGIPTAIGRKRSLVEILRQLF